MARTMEQMEQLLGHALVRVEAVEKLHDRHEAETKSLMHEWRAEARVAAQLIQALQAQVVQLTSRVSTLDEALLAERRRNEQLSQERAERLRAQAEASENALREQFRALSARVEAQVDQGETSLRDYASQLRAQADASEGVLRQEIARLRSEAAVSLSAASPNSSRPPTAAELGPRAVASSQPAAWRTAPIAIEDCGTCSYCLDKVKFGGPGIKRRVCKRKLEARLTGVDTAPSAPAAAEDRPSMTDRAVIHDDKRRKMASGGTIHTVREDDESHEDDPSRAAGSSSSGSCHDGNSTQRVLARLQCTICLQTLEDPHSLPCIHTFCYKCIDQWARQSTELRCPLCKLPFFRRSILRNHTVAEIVRALACT